MIHAYDKVYLEKARIALARMLDFAIYDLGYKLSDFFELFISSGVASEFETGTFSLTVGMSGVELAYKVLEDSGLKCERIAAGYSVDRSPEYWTGWALAYYQWESSFSFENIVSRVPIEDIMRLYTPYHEMDIRHFCDKMSEMMQSAGIQTNLKRRRKMLGLSQSQLSEKSGIPVRTIQQYEQRQKNINKAQTESLLALAKVLCCNVEDLIEPVL